MVFSLVCLLTRCIKLYTALFLCQQLFYFFFHIFSHVLEKAGLRASGCGSVRRSCRDDQTGHAVLAVAVVGVAGEGAGCHVSITVMPWMCNISFLFMM